MPATHATLTTPFAERATSASHPLSSYLFRLMELKSSNLCLSADVTNVRELVSLADRAGPSIVVLKTHYDLIAGWDYNPQTGTGARLAALARKHGFLVFEDRKFVDIGKTVQAQYTAGTARIIDWAHITNANMEAGPDMVRALAQAAARWKERYHYEIRTSCTVGTPLHNGFEGHGDHDENYDNDEEGDSTVDPLTEGPSPAAAAATAHATDSNGSGGELGTGIYMNTQQQDGRKGSIVSITTLTQSYESADSPRLAKNGTLLGQGDDAVFPGIEEPPVDRGLLLLAQMSTRGCLMTPAYTQACVEAARAHKEFVMGFVAQECLNTAPDDSFIHMTPGCKLPPPPATDHDHDQGEQQSGTESGPVGGDGLGQQYNTPDKLVRLAGTDIVIVGRGIIEADDPQTEAERYRKKAWSAYEARLRGQA